MSRLARLVAAIPWKELPKQSVAVVIVGAMGYGAAEFFFGSDNSFELNLICNDAEAAIDESSCLNSFRYAVEVLSDRGLRASDVKITACINAEGQCDLTIVQEEGEETETTAGPTENARGAEAGPAPGFGS